ncbi:hypothetical protein PFISCL1PPCAC_28756, partial [Pristionchus fissidentatus]
KSIIVPSLKVAVAPLDAACLPEGHQLPVDAARRRQRLPRRHQLRANESGRVGTLGLHEHLQLDDVAGGAVAPRHRRLRHHLALVSHADVRLAAARARHVPVEEEDEDDRAHGVEVPPDARLELPRHRHEWHAILALSVRRPSHHQRLRLLLLQRNSCGGRGGRASCGRVRRSGQ